MKLIWHQFSKYHNQEDDVSKTSSLLSLYAPLLHRGSFFVFALNI